MSDIRSFVDTIFDELVSIRRDIHAHPELGMHEVRTSALIRSELEKMGVDEIRQPLPTAVVALIHGKKGPGKCVALRADIDALPVHEETGLPFASETVSHIQITVFGGLIMFFLIVEPHGLARLWQIAKEKLRLWPFPH